MSFDINLSALSDELEKYADPDRIAKAVILAAAPTLKANLRVHIKRAADRGYATGELVHSVTYNKQPSKNKYGYYLYVTAEGKNSRGERNNAVLAYLNYGTTRQAARPVISGATTDSEVTCLKLMQEKFNEVTR